MQTTLFRNGGSQAMRIPAEFRFEGESVEVEWSDELDALIVRSSYPARMEKFFQLLKEYKSNSSATFYPVDKDGHFDVLAYFEEDAE